MKNYKYQMKPLFEKRMRALLPGKEDFERFERIVHEEPQSFIRCNTLKISPEELLGRLSKKWKVSQPFPGHPEIMLVTQDLQPGELGNALEHLLGYYYIQEVSSMLSPIALNPKPGELVLDLMASPGSKTTQIAALMKNSGTIIANDLKIQRIKILVSNLERCGVTNVITSRKDAISFCSAYSKSNLRKFDRILVDAPCSGEGILRSSPKTFLMWNYKVVKSLGKQQKKFIAFALKCMKKGGTLVYSTCTHAPEENEAVVSFALENFPVEIKKIEMPLKCRSGLTSWEEKEFHEGTSKSCRIYPQDNNSEGFFVARLKLLEEVK